MGGLFSSGKEKPKAVTQNDIDQHVHELKILRDRYTRYRRQQEALRDAEISQARACAQQGKIERAKFLLRQKKLREKYITQADQSIENLESQINQVSTAQMNVEYMKELDATNQLLKKLNDLMPLEQVEGILEENREQAQRIEEIGRIVQQDLDPESTRAAEEDYDRMLQELGIGEPEAEGEEPPEVYGGRVALPA
jgi:charged multivesicular body protein 6